MKQPKHAIDPQVPVKPLDAKQFPSHAQTDATAGRDKVREVLHVHAPRQSKRPVERSSKRRTAA